MNTSWMRNGVLVTLLAVLLCAPALTLAGQDSGDLERRLSEAGKVLEDGYQVTVDDVTELQALYNEIAEAELDLLLPDIRMFLFIAREKYEGGEITGSEEGAVGIKAVSKPPGSPGVPLTISAVSAGLFNLFWILGEHYHSKYADAATPAEASRLMPYWQAFDILTYISAGVSITGFGFAMPLLVSGPLDFSVSKPPGETVQQQVEYLLTARERNLRKLARSERKTYALMPQVLLGSGLTFMAAETLLFAMGSEVYRWNVPDQDMSSGMDPVSLSGMIIGLTGSALLVSSLVTALLNPPPLTMETNVVRSRVELEKRGYDTAPLEQMDRDRLVIRQEMVLEKLERGEAMKKWQTPVLISAAGAGITSLVIMGILMDTREKAEEAIRDGFQPEGIVPSDGWIIGTGTAGGVLLSAAGVLLALSPPLRKIREELGFIAERLVEKN